MSCLRHTILIKHDHEMQDTSSLVRGLGLPKGWLWNIVQGQQMGCV